MYIYNVYVHTYYVYYTYNVLCILSTYKMVQLKFSLNDTAVSIMKHEGEECTLSAFEVRDLTWDLTLDVPATGVRCRRRYVSADQHQLVRTNGGRHPG